MYHCHIHFYLAGCGKAAFRVLKALPPLENFTHSIAESDGLEPALLEKADVILTDVSRMDAGRALELLRDGKRPDAECILIAGQPQLEQLAEALEWADDLWAGPLSEQALRLRLTRWQGRYKLRMDLWEAREFLDTTINSVPNLIWYKDQDGSHEMVNDSFCRTVGKTKEQVRGKGHAYIWNVEHDDPACTESDREVMQGRETRVSEEMVQTGEGPRLLTTYKSPLFDLDGSVMGTVGVAIDITQERAYEQEIVRKNQTLETLFTTMECGVLCHSLDGSRLLSINQAALRILGYKSQEEMEGFSLIADTVAGEDQERLRECIRSLKKPGDSASIGYRVRHHDGEELYVMGNIKLREEGGERFYQRFLLDCTAQKLREQQEREESERRQMALVHALTVDYSMACFFNLDTGLGMPLALQEQGDPIREAVFSGSTSFREGMERYIRLIVHPDDQEMLRQATARERLVQELSEAKVYSVNYRVALGDEVEYFQLKAVRAGSWEEQRAVVLGFRNVDEETRRELVKKNLLEDALMQAKRASKAKSTFLSNMSHDIRTPMNAIVGFTSLAITHIDNKEQVEEYLKKIMTSGNHLLSLINDILDMSRIESGKIHLSEELCSLPDILHSLHSIVQADVHAKQMDLFIDTVDVLDEEIYCDKLRLNQVLLNLLSNSIKYTGAGGTVGLRITEKGGAPAGYANYEFQIRDNGIGMSEEFVQRIFEPFERERNSTISGIQGTGLGMAITKNIVDMMNGQISVRSEEGKGTEFTVLFPFRIRTGAKEPQTIPELHNARALVVDDDFNTCDSVSYMLQQIGLRAEWTLSGKEAVLRTRQAVARKDDYCVYIVDWLMPDMNGVEVARRIRKETEDENAAIIVLTAYDWADIEEEARGAGVTAFCSKPLFLSELRRCLCSIVGAETPSEPKEERKRPLHTGRILLAEDNELNQEIAVAILKEAGFTTEVAGNGDAAVKMLSASKPGYYQLVLMDVQMPVMNGYEATLAIRNLKDPELAEVPIIAMTANAFDEDRREALQCGMNGHIAKPIDIDNLLETLDRILS